MKKSIYSLAHEDDSEFDVDTSEPINITDVINDTETSAELHTDIANIDNMIEIHSDATERLDILDRVVSDNEVKLQTPEIITIDDVLITQESMRTTMIILGYKPIKGRLASEAASNTVRALQLSTEAIKEFMSKAVEHIKTVIVKIVAAIKKMYVNILAWLDSSDKNSKLLIDKLKASTKNTDKKYVPNEKYSSVTNMIGIIIEVSKEYIKDSAKLKDILHSYLSAVSEPHTLNVYNDALKISAGLITTFVNDSGNVSKDAGDTLGSKIADMFNKTEFVNNNLFLKELMKYYTDRKFVSTGNFGNFIDTVEHIPAMYHGKSMSVVNILTYNENNAERKHYYTLKLNTYKSHDIERHLSQSYEIALLNKPDLISILTDISTKKSARKNYIDNALKKISDMEAEVTNLSTVVAKQSEDKQRSTELTGIVNTYIKSINIGVTDICYGGIINNIKGTQGVLKFCNLCAKEYL